LRISQWADSCLGKKEEPHTKFGARLLKVKLFCGGGGYRRVEAALHSHGGRREGANVVLAGVLEAVVGADDDLLVVFHSCGDLATRLCCQASLFERVVHLEVALEGRDSGGRFGNVLIVLGPEVLERLLRVGDGAVELGAAGCYDLLEKVFFGVGHDVTLQGFDWANY